MSTKLDKGTSSEAPFSSVRLPATDDGEGKTGLLGRAGTPDAGEAPGPWVFSLACDGVVRSRLGLFPEITVRSGTPTLHVFVSSGCCEFQESLSSTLPY